MSDFPSSFSEWQDYPLKLDSINPANVLNVAEIPKLGSGKTDFSATKKIALV
jgi:hypothetical protein